MPHYTDEDKYQCADRELKLRKKVYPRWVEIKKMTQDQAEREIDIMEAIARDYEERRQRLLL